MADLFTSIATRIGPQLLSDPRRVVTRLFVPGDDVPGYRSHADELVDRLLALDEDRALALRADVVQRYGSRHRDLAEELANHFEAVSHRIGVETMVTPERAQLIGACLTDEYAVEGAALTNPSIVPAPDQSGLRDGELRFVLSVRCIGEGHISSIGFRTGVIGPGGAVTVDQPSGFAVRSRSRRTHYPRGALIHDPLPDDDEEVLAFVWSELPEQVTDADLDRAVERLPERLSARQDCQPTVARLRSLAAGCYEVWFPTVGGHTDERILWPHSEAESHGMEDARFVRYTDNDGTVEYQGTYTAASATAGVSHLIRTIDFETFRVIRLAGEAAGTKGLALFPRPIGGVRHALCRPHLEKLSLTTSIDGVAWDTPRLVRQPRHDWEILKTGNCGSPIETEAGWLVIIHGVGPMREYRLGALLLDLHDPSTIRAELTEPLLVPEPSERDGYVPNVVYSCGSIVHDDTLVIPYGSTDSGIGFATIPLPDLLKRMRPVA